MLTRLATVAFLAALAPLTGCSSSSDADIEPASPKDTPTRDEGSSTTTIIPPGGGVVGSSASVAVFANSQEALYRLDPMTLALTKVGAFDCVRTPTPGASQQGMGDIALDASGTMYGVGLREGGYGLVSIDKTTASCKPIGGVIGESLTGLSFVSMGTETDVNKAGAVGDVLVATGADGSYNRIDPTTGVVSRLGFLSFLGGSKGSDLVSVVGAGTFLVGGYDHGQISLINPANGAVIKEIGKETKAGNSNDIVSGLAYWGGKLYTFGYSGQILEVDPTTGDTKALEAKGDPISFWGAAVETNAPTTRPN